ncbi:MAG TPA: MgtC/SapB family protein [Candidatus Limnocylindria bacterium]|nr:MgtC/SapB family protein [Candidatus Limnocylindria bacterium]
MTEIRELTMVSIAVRTMMSLLVGGLLGMDRGRKNRPAGLRTYMLVCLGSAMVMMTNQYVTQVFKTGDPVRLGAQVISGIGFLGAGSIVVTGRSQIRGITTAAGLWASACVGLAIGIGLYEVAVIGTLLVFFVLTYMQKLDVQLRKRARVIDVYVELDDKSGMSGFIKYLRNMSLEISNLQMQNEYHMVTETLSFTVTVRSQTNQNRAEILRRIQRAPHLSFVEEL